MRTRKQQFLGRKQSSHSYPYVRDPATGLSTSAAVETRLCGFCGAVLPPKSDNPYDNLCAVCDDRSDRDVR